MQLGSYETVSYGTQYCTFSSEELTLHIRTGTLCRSLTVWYPDYRGYYQTKLGRPRIFLYATYYCVLTGNPDSYVCSLELPSHSVQASHTYDLSQTLSDSMVPRFASLHRDLSANPGSMDSTDLCL